MSRAAPESTLACFLQKSQSTNFVAQHHWNIRRQFFAQLDDELFFRWETFTKHHVVTSSHHYQNQNQNQYQRVDASHRTATSQLLSKSLRQLDALMTYQQQQQQESHYHCPIIRSRSNEGDGDGDGDEEDDVGGRDEMERDHIKRTCFGMRKTIAVVDRYWHEFTPIRPSSHAASNQTSDLLTTFSGRPLFDFFQWVQRTMYKTIEGQETDKGNTHTRRMIASDNPDGMTCLQAWLRESAVGVAWANDVGLGRENAGSSNTTTTTPADTSTSTPAAVSLSTLWNNIQYLISHVNPVYEPSLDRAEWQRDADKDAARGAIPRRGRG